MNAPPPGPSPGAPSGTLPPAGPQPWPPGGYPSPSFRPMPRRSRTPALIGVVVIVIVVLVLGLFLFGLLSFSGMKSSTGNGGTSGAMTYLQATPVASSQVAGFSGGGWALLEASGYDSNQAANLPFGGTLSGTGCAFTPLPGSTGTISFPAFTGSFTSGTAPSWAFLFRNASGYVAVVAVTEGGSSVIGTISSACGLFGLILPVPSGIVNSPGAVSAVASNISAFLQAHPGANESFALLGGVSFLGARIGPEWAVTISTCPATPSLTGSVGSSFNATVNATSGGVIYAQTTPSVSCASSGSGGGGQPFSITFGTGTPSQAGSTYDDLLPIAVTNGLTTNLFGLQITEGTGAVLGGLIPPSTCLVNGPLSGCTATSGNGGQAWYAVLLSPGGSVLAIYDPLATNWQTASGPVTLSNSQSIVLISNSPLAGSGDFLSAFGTGSSSVSGSTFL